MLLVGIRLFHGTTRKAFQGPVHGDCGAARQSILVEIEAALWLSNVLSPSILSWKKSNRDLSKAKTEASVQSFRFL